MVRIELAWFRASSMRTALFYVTAQRVVVNRSHLQGSGTYPSHFQAWPLEMGPVCCPETSARNYHCLLRNNPNSAVHRIELVLRVTNRVFRAYVTVRWLKGWVVLKCCVDLGLWRTRGKLANNAALTSCAIPILSPGCKGNIKFNGASWGS
jgi:hypothetical protein